MELPVTTPNSRRSGIPGTNNILDYDGGCLLSPGFARASRIARHRLALYGEQSLLEAKGNHDDYQQDTPIEEPYIEYISEAKSLPYISSSSTLDNTTISASISLGSHSVYSTPPPSVILHTPIITVTGPVEQNSDGYAVQEDGSEYRSDSENAYQSESSAINDATKADDVSSTPEPVLGTLARRRGFQGLLIITSFPSSHTLLSPLSIIFQSASSRKSLDHTSCQTSSPTTSITTDTTSFSSPRSISSPSEWSPKTDLSHFTPWDEPDPFSTHGDSFYSNKSSQSQEDVNDFTIYTSSEKILDDVNLPFVDNDAHSTISNYLGPNGNIHPLATNIYDISTYVPDEALRPKREESCTKNLSQSYLSPPPSNLPQIRRISASSVRKRDIDDVPPSPASRSNNAAHRSTMAVTNGNVVDFAHRSEDMDADFHMRFSFPYYPFRDNGQWWGPSGRSTSARDTSNPSPGPLKDGDYIVPAHEISSVNADPVSVDVEFCVPTTNVIPLRDGDISRSPGLSSNDCGIFNRTDNIDMVSKPDDHSGSPTSSSRISNMKVFSEHGYSSRHTRSISFSDRGGAVQAWISVVDSDLASAVTSGSDHLPPAIENPTLGIDSPLIPELSSRFEEKEPARDGRSAVRDKARRTMTELQVSLNPSYLTSCRPKSLGSPSAPSQATAFGYQRSSVVYSRERHTLDMSERDSALRPLMLPLRLASEDSLGSDSTTNSKRDMETEPSSLSFNLGDTTTSKTSLKRDDRSSSHIVSQVSFGDLLEALHLRRIGDNFSGPSVTTCRSLTTATDIGEPDTSNPSSDITVSWGIAL